MDTAAWQHVSDAEKAEGHAVYDAENDTITFPNRTSAWAARMVYTLPAELADKDVAVECDIQLTGGILTVLPAFADGSNFAGVGLESGASSSSFEGVCYQNGKAIDDFYYRDKDKEGNPKVICGAVAKTDNRLRFEFYRGASGTLAGGYARVLTKAAGAEAFTLVGRYDFPEKYTDTADASNRLALQLVLGTGTVSRITVEAFTEPIASGKGLYSEQWGYAIENDETIGSAYFEDRTGLMTLNGSGAWDTRMLSKQIPDVQGKCFAFEFDCSAKTGGAIGLIPFYESEDNWYGIYLDRGASAIDGAGFKNGELIDNFGYKDDTLYPRLVAESAPILNNRFRLRFEFYPNAQGGAAGATCRIYYRLSADSSATDEWRRVGVFVLPDTLADDPLTPNRLGIHARLLKGTACNFAFTEIAADTQTGYYVKSEEGNSADVYPDDGYIEPDEPDEPEVSAEEPSDAPPAEEPEKPEKPNSSETQEAFTKRKRITEYRPVPWWSIALIAGGGALLVLTALFLILRRKKKQDQPKMPE